MPCFRRIPHLVIGKSLSLHFFVYSNLCITFPWLGKKLSIFHIAYIFVHAYLHSHLSFPHFHSSTNCQYFIKRSLAANLIMESFLSSKGSTDSFCNRFWIPYYHPTTQIPQPFFPVSSMQFIYPTCWKCYSSSNDKRPTSASLTTRGTVLEFAIYKITRLE